MKKHQMEKVPVDGLSPAEKVETLNELYPFDTVFKVDDLVFCLHCSSSFKAQDVTRDVVDGLLICPNDRCDGNPMDWSLEPWS